MPERLLEIAIGVVLLIVVLVVLLNVLDRLA